MMARIPQNAATSAKGWPLGVSLGVKPKAHAGMGAKDAALALGLAPNLDLAREAADFYLLMDAGFALSEAEQRLQAHARALAPHLAGYIEAACLGEARHAINGVPNLRKQYVKRAVIRSPLGKAWLKDLMALRGGGRHCLWANYPTFREKYGRNALLFLVLVFQTGKWPGGFGGKKWGNCAQTVLAYRRRQLSPVLFVDTALGLYHNGALVFNKLWRVDKLRVVLDLNLAQKLEGVAQFATPQVRALWEKARAQEGGSNGS